MKFINVLELVDEIQLNLLSRDYIIAKYLGNMLSSNMNEWHLASRHRIDSTLFKKIFFLLATARQEERNFQFMTEIKVFLYLESLKLANDF